MYIGQRDDLPRNLRDLPTELHFAPSFVRHNTCNLGILHPIYVSDTAFSSVISSV